MAHIGRPHSLWRAALDTGRSTLSFSVWARLSPLPEHIGVTKEQTPFFGSGGGRVEGEKINATDKFLAY